MTTTANGKERVLKFGDFVAGAYRAWGKRRAKGLLRLAIHTGLVQFRGREHLVMLED
jgi:hypothetical protein